MSMFYLPFYYYSIGKEKPTNLYKIKELPQTKISQVGARPNKNCEQGSLHSLKCPCVL